VLLVRLWKPAGFDVEEVAMNKVLAVLLGVMLLVGSSLSAGHVPGGSGTYKIILRNRECPRSPLARRMAGQIRRNPPKKVLEFFRSAHRR
jgi:hypothetical protein